MWKWLNTIFQTGCVTEKTAAPSPLTLRGRLQQTESCSQCHHCVAACPTGALTTQPDWQWNPERCTFCGLCLESCERHLLQHVPESYHAFHTALGKELAEETHRIFGRSLAIRHLDAGSCNACDFEMAALGNPYYDLARYGISFVASPRHADLLMVTGGVTHHLKDAVLRTYEAMPEPKRVLTVGACSSGGCVNGAPYALAGKVEDFIPVHMKLPGCPPRPQALLYALLLLIGRKP